MKLLPAAFILTMLAGCSIIVRTVNDVRQPKVETAASINKWLKRNGLAGYEVMTVAPGYFLDATTFYVKRKLVFNKNGKVAELGTNQTGVVCHFKTPGEIEKLKPGFPEFTDFLLSMHRSAKSKQDFKNGNYEECIDSIYYNLDTLNRYVHALSGLKTKIDYDEGPDYIVIIPFFIYAGTTIQPADIKKYLRAIKANPYSRFKVILLNLDKQMWWGGKWNNSIRFRT